MSRPDPTQRPWGPPGDAERAAPIQRDASTEVCIVGAGIAGLTTAYLLASVGKPVIVLDAATHTGGGETRSTTAHLACVLDDRFTELERIRGQEISRLAAQSHAAAIDAIESIVRAEQIDCGFRRLDGYLFLDPGRPTSFLDEEAAAARRAGLNPEKIPRLPWSRYTTGPCLRFANQGQFQPARYVAGLRHALTRMRVPVHGETTVIGVEGGQPVRVRTKAGPTVTARAAVVATNTPVHTTVTGHIKLAAYTTYAIGVPVTPGSVPLALYWDTADPYHYLRLAPAGQWQGGAEADLLIVGGADHKTGQENDPTRRWDDLTQWARERFPDMGPVRFGWSGQVMETLDGLGYIGTDPSGQDNVFLATGDSGMGMTHGTIAGLLLTDLLLGRDNPWATAYDPSRAPLHSADTFVGENLNVARQYLDWLTPGEVSAGNEIRPGHGAVIRSGLTKRAVYRADDGRLHVLSAVCPHLGCIVRWNDAEKTWDCPCHGSRFTALGKVTHGPATSDLAAAE